MFFRPCTYILLLPKPELQLLHLLFFGICFQIPKQEFHSFRPTLLSIIIRFLMVHQSWFCAWSLKVQICPQISKCRGCASAVVFTVACASIVQALGRARKHLLHSRISSYFCLALSYNFEVIHVAMISNLCFRR